MRILFAIMLTSTAALAQDGILPLKLDLPAAKGRSLELRLDLRAGKIEAGIGRVSFSRSPAELDLGGLSVVGGKIVGELQARVASDGYMAATNFTCKLDAPLANQLQARPAPGTVARLSLSCENAVTHVSGKGQGRRLGLVLAMRNGQAFAARAVPVGSMTDVNFATRLRRFAVHQTDGKLGGELEVQLQPQDASAKPIQYRYRLDGQVIGDLATGRISVHQDGQARPDMVSFVGQVRQGQVPAPADALYKLTLHDALGPGKFLDLYLSATAGQITHGFGTAPNFNNATHDVEVSQLKLAGNKLAGRLAVTIQPDPWIPKDRQPIACFFNLDSTVQDGELTGNASGTAGTNQVVAPLDGGLDPKPAGQVLTGGTVKLEAGLLGDGGYRARAFVAFTVKDGKITGGKLWNNHSKLAGTVDGGQIRLEKERLVGSIQATVTVGAGAKEGQYEFEINSLMVGAAGAGVFTTRLGEATRSGRLWATVKLE